MKLLLCIYFVLLLAFANASKQEIKPITLESNVAKHKPMENRTIQGDASNLYFAPYLVSIGVNGHLCSGAILNQQWILTSAQCVVG